MKKTGLILILLVTLQIFQQELRPLLPAAERIVSIRPKLVLAIVVDQFRYDYLLRFNDDYKLGLRQLLSKGAVFSNARYDHYPTYTSVGHAAFLTGAYPGTNGIIGNTWYDRDSGKSIASASDTSVKLVGGTDGPGSSPHNLLVSTVGDEMKIASQGKCKVFGISLKDYSGILATGHMADGVYWFDSRSGNFVTSSYFLDDLPEWLKGLNRKRPADRYKNAEWLGTKMPEEADSKLYGMLQFTPFGNELVEEMAEEVIGTEKLGSRAETDLLVLSFSSNDFVGHSFGPDSAQVHEIAIATDKILGKLFSFIDSRIGMKNVTVAFAADHGVAPLPETSAARKMPGGRMDFTFVQEAVQKALVQKFGEGRWIAATPEDSIYLNWDLIDEKKLTREEVTSAAAQAALKIPHVFRVYTREQLIKGAVAEDSIGRRVFRSYSVRRSADLFILPDPYYMFIKMGTTHGSAFGYDTHVPLIFMGPGIRAGKFYGNVVMNDVAPTLATILNIEMPSGAEGRILSEIFSIP
jgi:predicted AlkP superfamily pyrophosphatase or phosphodiesterase